MIAGNVATGVSFFGELAAAALRVIFNPALSRPTSMIYHMENFALRAVPIIVTINFLVGCIVEQQGLYQLRRFGASILCDRADRPFWSCANSACC